MRTSHGMEPPPPRARGHNRWEPGPGSPRQTSTRPRVGSSSRPQGQWGPYSIVLEANSDARTTQSSPPPIMNSSLSFQGTAIAVGGVVASGLVALRQPRERSGLFYHQPHWNTTSCPGRRSAFVQTGREQGRAQKCLSARDIWRASRLLRATSFSFCRPWRTSPRTHNTRSAKSG